jgi:hypothetical protein
MRLSVTHTLGLCPKPRTRREAGLGMIHPSPAPASSVLGLQGVKRLSRHKRERKNLSRIYSTVLLTPFQPFLPALSQMSQKPRKKAYKGCHALAVMVFGKSLDLQLSTGLLHCCAAVAPSGGAFRVSGRALENSHAPKSLMAKPVECGWGVLENRSRSKRCRTASLAKVRRLRVPASRCEVRQPSPYSPVHQGRTG